jgi:hypothetical protein
LKESPLLAVEERFGDSKMKNDFDICSGKHGGNEQSRKANNRNMQHRTAQRLAVLELIKDSPNGLSMKEVADLMNTQFSTVSGRGSELKKFGLVEPTGEVREGSAVLQATRRVFQPIVVTKVQPAPEPKEDIKPITPAEAQRQFKALEDLFEHTSLSNEGYDNAKARIYRALGLWGDCQ